MSIHSVPHPNQTLPTSGTVIERFCRLAGELPNDIAIVFEDTQLTFSHLDNLASRIANAMRANGIKFGDTVGLCIERRPEAIASMLAAFKIGAVFVPLDPEYPADRIRYMISDASIKLIVTYDRSENPIAQSLAAVGPSHSNDSDAMVWLDCASSLEQYPVQIDHAFPAPNDLAYIMYTSGSTGKPKGVQIEHRSLAVYCVADAEIYQLTAADRTLQFSTLNFDIAIEEIFPPLLTGGVVVIRPQGRSASHNELSSIIDQYQITAIHIATAYWHEWVDLMVATGSSVPASLRLVIATGEKVSVEHYHRWLSICKQEVLWCNAYGPTETTVTATVFIPDKQFNDKHMPIGKPLKGYSAYILDDVYRPLGVGETGSLFIGGEALARGYLNRPEKNAEAFLTIDLPSLGPTRIYRTGDLARWLPSGDIEYAGRVDHQIKVGSYRIEPGEIEATIATYPGVLESIVVYEEVNGQKTLIAYIAYGATAVDHAELRSYLKQKLPHYMVPGRYIHLESLPKTINGKIDRSRLPQPEIADSLVDDYELSSGIEQRMRSIWKDVLRCDQIGPEDDFFELGGSSLLVTRVVATIAIELGIELPVRDFFANPTLRSISCQIEHQLKCKSDQPQPSAHQAQTPHLQTRLPHVNATMISSGQELVFGVHYQPRAQRRNHSVLICNSLGHEQTRAYRNLQQLALQLSRHGFDVLRFDYRGTGNSTGSSVMPTASSFVQDIEVAVNHLQDTTGNQPLSLVGVRLGALLALNAKLPTTTQRILWDPVFDGDSYVRLVERFHQETLDSQTRFTYRVRTTVRPQAYGWQTTAEALTSLKELKADPTCLSDRTHCLFSDRYVEQEPGIDLAVFTHHQSLQDQLGWHDLRYAERAFSSPQLFKAIVEQLESTSTETQTMTQAQTLSAPVFAMPTNPSSLVGAY